MQNTASAAQQFQHMRGFRVRPSKACGSPLSDLANLLLNALHDTFTLNSYWLLLVIHVYLGCCLLQQFMQLADATTMPALVVPLLWSYTAWDRSAADGAVHSGMTLLSEPLT